MEQSEKELSYGEDVIAFNESWIDEDFLQDYGFISSKWDDEYNEYETPYEEGDDFHYEI